MARTLHVLWVILIQRGIRHLLLPALDSDELMAGDPSRVYDNLSPIGVGFFVAFVSISAVAVLTPLEVISTRLSVQRNSSQSGGFGEVPQDEDLPDLEYAGRDEDVIALRPEDNPYEGFVHCAKSILQEEGPEALLRAWWVTVAAALLTAFS